MRASGSVVEHLLAKEGVAGSDPRLALLFFKRYPMDTSFVTGGVPVHAPNINVPANIQAVINCLCVHLVIG